MRFPNSLLSLGVAVACAAAFANVAPAQAVLHGTRVVRDWNKCPAVVEMARADDLYAVGDVHGDYDRLVTLLSAAKIIARPPDRPDSPKWSAGRAVLVCTGDLIDKWKDSLKVIAFFRALQAEAGKAGGRVVVTMGNHEAEFLADPEAAKAHEFRDELAGKGLDFHKVADGQDAQGIGAYLRSLPLAARVGEWFFAHAGNTQGRTVRQLDAALRAGVDADGFGSPILSDADSLLEARLHTIPWWEREADHDHPDQSRKRLQGLVKALGVKHLVMGHQPGNVQFSDGDSRKQGEAFSKFDGLIFLIDCGMSRGIGGTGSGYSTGAVLHIEHDTATALFADGSSKVLWAKSGGAKTALPGVPAASSLRCATRLRPSLHLICDDCLATGT